MGLGIDSLSSDAGQAEALLAQGRDHTTSRMVCNVHWMSDTEAGMAVGAAAFARLQNNARFQATISAARTELASGQATPPDAERCEQRPQLWPCRDARLAVSHR